MLKIVFINDNSIELIIPTNFNDDNGEPYKWFNFYNYNIENNEKKTRLIVSNLINIDLIDKKKNIIDSGAFIGDNSLPWAKQISGKVYAIDPSTNNERLINYLAEINDIKNITFFPLVLSGKKKELYYNGDLDFNSFSFEGINKILSYSLDELHFDNKINDISFIHLDVEGEEYKVLIGSLFTIKKYKPVIIFEQHILSDNVTDSINLLNIYGYHTFIINEQSGARNDCRNLLAIPDEKYDLFCKQFIFFEYLIDINNLENEKNLCLDKNS